MQLMNKSQPEELLKAGLHLGHKASRLHPKFRPFIFNVQQGSVIIDLFLTSQELDRAREFAYELGKDNKKLLVVATKKQARKIVQDLCQKNNVMFITHKWISGFLTNYSEISKNVKKMLQMREAREKGEWQEFVKHEQVALEKELRKIESFYAGVESMTTTPDALFLIDIKQEAVAVTEANKKQLPIIAVVDTNCDPTLVTHAIPANDDAISSITYLAQSIIEAYAQGRKQAKEVVTG